MIRLNFVPTLQGALPRLLLLIFHAVDLPNYIIHLLDLVAHCVQRLPDWNVFSPVFLISALEKSNLAGIEEFLIFVDDKSVLLNLVGELFL